MGLFLDPEDGSSAFLIQPVGLFVFCLFDLSFDLKMEAVRSSLQQETNRISLLPACLTYYSTLKMEAVYSFMQ
jgi:hypothetical protein